MMIIDLTKIVMKGRGEVVKICQYWGSNGFQPRLLRQTELLIQHYYQPQNLPDTTTMLSVKYSTVKTDRTLAAGELLPS